MLCESCQAADATCKVANVSDGVKHVQHLCEACAEQREPPEPTIHSGIKEILQNLVVERASEHSCSECGMTFSMFRRHGRLGCAADYDVFGEELEQTLERIHGQTSHRGKHPGRPSPAIELERSRRELAAKLTRAVEQEAYEEAAGLRDQLRQIEQDLDGT